MKPEHDIHCTIYLARSIWRKRSQGAECVCVPFDTSVLKLYRFYDQAQRARRRQLEAYSHELAPRPSFEIFRVYFIGGDNRGYFGYLSEYAAPCDSPVVKSLTLDERRSLRARLADFGIARIEVNNRNSGRLADGTLVFLDFGDLSATTRQSRGRKHAETKPLRRTRQSRRGHTSRGVL